MASLNLGDINFGLGADTQGLVKAITKMSEFGREINKVARTQAKGSQETLRAYIAQEKATRAALQQVLNLNAAVKRSGGDPRIIARNVNAFKALTRVMTSGKVSALNFARAQDRFRAQLGKSTRALNKFRKVSNDTRMAKFSNVMRDLESASVLAVGPLSGIGARVRALGVITSRSTLKLAGLLVGITALGVGLVKLAVGAIKTATIFQRIDAIMVAASGSTVIAADEFAFVTRVANKLGLGLSVVAEEYAKLAVAAKGTEIAGQQTRTIFEGIAVAGVALKMSTQQVGQALLAITQMMSKGKVESQELRLQLGNSLVGAFKLFAKASGKTMAAFNKDLQQGKVGLDILIKVGRRLIKQYSGPAAMAANSLSAATTKITNSVLLFNHALDSTIGISNTYKSSLSVVAKVIDKAANNMDNLVSGVVSFTATMSAWLALKVFVKLAKAVVKLRVAFTALNIAMLANPAIGLANAFVRLLVLVGVGIGTFLIYRNVLTKAKEGTDDLVSSIDKYLSTLGKEDAAVRQSVNVFINAAKQRIAAKQNEIKALQNAVANTSFLSKFANKVLSLFGTSKTSKGIQQLLSDINALEKRIKVLNAIKSLPVPLKITEVYVKAKTAIEKMVYELKGLKKVQASESEGLGAVKSTQALVKAQKALKDLSTKGDKTAMAKYLTELGYAGKTSAEKLGKLYLALENVQEETRKFTTAAKRTPKALEATQRSIQATVDKAKALSEGPKALKEYERVLSQNKAIDVFRAKLEKTILSQEQVTTKVKEFTDALNQVAEAQKTFDRLKTILDSVQKGFDRAFDRIGKSITDALIKGESAMISFGNIANAILSEVMQTLLDITLISPLKKAAGSFLQNMLFSGGGGFGGGSSSGLGTPSATLALGGVFSRGNLTPFASGGIVSSPTIFPMASGAGLMGEAGPEAVIPLKRASNGRLGISATGFGGSQVIVNIINNVQADVKAQQSQDSKGNPRIDVIIDKIVAGNIRNGGQTQKALTEVFPLSIETIGR